MAEFCRPIWYAFVGLIRIHNRFNALRPHEILGYKSRTHGLGACLHRRAGYALLIGFLGLTGATAASQLSFHTDHSMGADHFRHPVYPCYRQSRPKAKRRHDVNAQVRQTAINGSIKAVMGN
jgi:hypothetical protein